MMKSLTLAMVTTALSASEWQDASTIVLARIESVKPAPWTAAPRAMKLRTVELTVAVEKVWKGDPAPRVVLVVRQAEPGPRSGAPPQDAQPWSNKPLEPGTQFILFSRDGLKSCFRVEPPTIAPEVDLLMLATQEKWPVTQLVKRFDKTPTSLTALWILDQPAVADYTSYEDFNSLLVWLEQPSIHPTFRRQMVADLFARAIQRDPIPAPFAARLIVSGFRIAGQPGGDPIKQQLLTAFLPNFLGLQSAIPKKDASSVFAAFPADLPSARSTAAAIPALAAWFPK